MKFNVEILSLLELKGIFKGTPPHYLWHDTNLLGIYDDILVIVVWRGETLCGYWPVPLDRKEEKLHARRRVRVLPYASPWIADLSFKQKCSVMKSMLAFLQETVDSIELPMDPSCTTVHVANGIGGFMEWRHTHRCLKINWDGKLGTNKTTNHIKVAERNVRIVVDDDPKNFDFNRAIVGGGEAQEKRKTFALECHQRRQAMVISAMQEQIVVGAVFLIRDHQVSYLFHSWFDREGPRGVPSLLVREAIDKSFSRWGVTVFDFEGSILCTVNDFFTGFSLELCPYPHLYWAKDTEYMLKLIRESIAIPGRRVFNQQ